LVIFCDREGAKRTLGKFKGFLKIITRRYEILENKQNKRGGEINKREEEKGPTGGFELESYRKISAGESDRTDCGGGGDGLEGFNREGGEGKSGRSVTERG